MQHLRISRKRAASVAIVLVVTKSSIAWDIRLRCSFLLIRIENAAKTKTSRPGHNPRFPLQSNNA